MPFLLARNWWSLMLRGMLAVAFGIITFLWPAITLAALVLLYGAYALADGVMSLVGMVHASRRQERWWALLLEGLVGIGAGLVTFFWPGITAFALVYVIAIWAFVTGALEIAAAIRLRKVVHGEWLLALGGIVSLILSVLLALRPVIGALAIALTVGIYALIFGVLLVSLGFRLRAWGHTLGGTTPLPAI